MTNSVTTPRQSRSVLVVDGDPNVLTLLSVILEGPKKTGKPRMRVLRARSVREAMDVLARKYVPVDLVLSNLTLPDADGENIEERVREVRPLVPVLYMSTMGDEQAVRIQGVQQAKAETVTASNGEGVFRAVIAALGPARALQAAGAR